MSVFFFLFLLFSLSYYFSFFFFIISFYSSFFLLLFFLYFSSFFYFFLFFLFFFFYPLSLFFYLFLSSFYLFGFVFHLFILFPLCRAHLARHVRSDVRPKRRPAYGRWRRHAIGCCVMVGLADKEQNYPSAADGGQQQRFAIARALALRPRVLLSTKTTSALDPEFDGEVLDVARGPRRESLSDDSARHSVMLFALLFCFSPGLLLLFYFSSFTSTLLLSSPFRPTRSPRVLQRRAVDGAGGDTPEAQVYARRSDLSSEPSIRLRQPSDTVRAELRGTSCKSGAPQSDRPRGEKGGLRSTSTSTSSRRGRRCSGVCQ